ncbi:MAG TPA: acyltransferase [Bryobacteraceae bacterium]|jgi:peptidoglycan/LPS O-acetylase OafA/YrhL|nr:acyltransferase [Bryobacteraceae bacterium]
MERKQHRLAGIDVLRGIAIFFVLMNHVNVRLMLNKVPYTKGIPRNLIGPLVWNGQNGVQIFFAVSGFLITSMSLRRWGSLPQVRVRDFYRMRFARIAPLLLTLLAVLSAFHLAGVNLFVVNPARTTLGRALLAALTFHVNVLEAHKGYLPPGWDILWSLSVEEVFYIGFPLACIVLGRGKLFIALLAAFVVAGPFARTVLAYNEVWREYSYLGGMDAIALGCLTALFLNSRQLERGTLRTLRLLGTLFIVFVMGFPVASHNLGLEGLGLDMSLLAAGACMVIAASAQAGGGGSIVLSPLRWLGRRSYEVYLTHVFVVIALLNIFIAAGKPLRGVPWYFAGTALLAGLLGEFVARYYSESLNAYLRGKHEGTIVPFATSSEALRDPA